jgi:hypothetical protein
MNNKFLSVALGLLAVVGLLGAAPDRVWGQSCDTTKTTICTLEVWLEHARKNQDKEVREMLKSRSIKVLVQTVQYWRPTGGHPPANIALGSAVSAEDARWVIDFALKYNDRIEFLIMQRLNPPNYAAVATSAWDEKSQIPLSPENLERLRDPKLTTEEFHALYIQLTGEAHSPKKTSFY